MVFYDSRWKDFTDTVRSAGAYIMFYQGGSIDHCTHVPGPVSESSSESEYNTACTAVMYQAHFKIINIYFSKKGTYVVP